VPSATGSLEMLRRRAMAAVGIAVNKQPHIARYLSRRGHRERLAFYRRFVAPGDLVFDVGAHLGNRTDVFRELGAHVVAVEPQGTLAARLQSRYAEDDRVTVVPSGLGAEPGEADMLISNASTLSTMNPEWGRATASSGRFRYFSWDGRERVHITTLDALVERFGVPAFCKIDVEGYEQEVLAGLHRPLSVVSLEWVPELQANTDACLVRLTELGANSFNVSFGEDHRLALPSWATLGEVSELLASHRGSMAFGDVYAAWPGVRSGTATPPDAG
jgi:FkbM family methyltransferase